MSGSTVSASPQRRCAKEDVAADEAALGTRENEAEGEGGLSLEASAEYAEKKLA